MGKVKIGLDQFAQIGLKLSSGHLETGRGSWVTKGLQMPVDMLLCFLLSLPIAYCRRRERANLCLLLNEVIVARYSGPINKTRSRSAL
jgi:hypothetical protein